MAELSKILSERRESTLPAMRIELFSTDAPAVRGRAAQALAFSSETMGVIEERLVSGRLELQIHENPKPLEEWVSHWQREPLHLLILFDEAGVFIRRSDMALPMPMSPFCVRKVIRYQKLRGTLRLDPTTDSPPFSEFMQLMNEADKGQRDSMPNAWADAENLRQVVDSVLQGEQPGAFWLALADRALPAESSLSSVRLLARHEDQRELLLLARDYRRLTELVRPAFNRWNLHVTTVQLSKLLEEGVHLTGAGILNLVKKDGTVEANQVLGLAGTLLAARDYARRYPGSLMVSVDQQIARHWLRLGKRTNERCDLIAVRQEGDELIIETIEVKSTQGTVSEIATATLDQASKQLVATLEAVVDGLAGVGPSGGPLSVPRCEMLKEVLVRGCLGKQVTPTLRGVWCGWLERIFQEEAGTPQIGVKGMIVRVALGESQPVPDEPIRDSNPPLIIRTLGETEVQQLLEESCTAELHVDSSSEVPLIPHPQPSRSLVQEATIIDHQTLPSMPATPAEGTTSVADSLSEISRNTSEPTHSSSVTVVDPVRDWPPQPNELGMIGQDETVRQLINRMNYARDFSERFKDTMFVGSAGVGKSSFARAIADQLLNQQPITFSGADLRNGRMIIERLDSLGKVPKTDVRPVRLEACVIFIDEVHALSASVANILLSALDDARLTTIDNVDYDFGDVVFLMATTDAGKLTEAFRSRPDRVLLRNYTLYELSGILWLHGKKELEEYSLPYDVCFEISARTRAQPRVQFEH